MERQECRRHYSDTTNEKKNRQHCSWKVVALLLVPVIALSVTLLSVGLNGRFQPAPPQPPPSPPDEPSESSSSDDAEYSPDSLISTFGKNPSTQYAYFS